MATDAQSIITVPESGPALNLFGRPSLQQIKTIIGLAAALSLGMGIVFWSLKPSYTPIFNDLSDRDAVQITEILQTENIPFQIESRTGLVLVPHDKLREARMKLVASGAPFSGSGGFESLHDEQSLGTSQFIETARYHHVLETELARTISAMRNVESARVHLALPKQSAFIRKRARPSASVMTKLLQGRTLAENQVGSIMHLVASSVPYMEAKDVTVVDQWGRMLTTGDAAPGMAETRTHIEYTRRVERDYVSRIEALLTPIVGYGRVKAEVNAEIDFSTNESFEELYTPDPEKIRSEQTQESESANGLAATGVPGALTNQPPDGAVLNGAGADIVGGPGGDTPRTNNRSAVRNYELDKTIRRSKQGLGEIVRLSIAVIIDNKSLPEAPPAEEGGAAAATTASYTQAELDRFSELVKNAVGFKEERGDSIEVINSAFQFPEEVEPLPDTPIWQQPWLWTLSKQVLAGLIVLFMIFGIVRPALGSLSSKDAGVKENKNNADRSGESDQKVNEDDKLTLTNQSRQPQGALAAPPHVYGDILNMARAMATDDPKRVAKVIKDWVATDG